MPGLMNQMITANIVATTIYRTRRYVQRFFLEEMRYRLEMISIKKGDLISDTLVFEKSE